MTTLLPSVLPFTFLPPPSLPNHVTPPVPTSSPNTRPPTSLQAIGVLARRAKEAEVNKYKLDITDKSVLENIELMKGGGGGEGGKGETLKTALTKRKGTLTVVAEYKRKLGKDGFVNEVFEPQVSTREAKRVRRECFCSYDGNIPYNHSSYDM